MDVDCESGLDEESCGKSLVNPFHSMQTNFLYPSKVKCPKNKTLVYGRRYVAKEFKAQLNRVIINCVLNTSNNLGCSYLPLDSGSHDPHNTPKKFFEVKEHSGCHGNHITIETAVAMETTYENHIAIEIVVAMENTLSWKLWCHYQP